MKTSPSKRPLKFYQDAWKCFNIKLGSTSNLPKCDIAVEAFKDAQRFNKGVELSGCMINRKSALSYMMDDVKRKVMTSKGAQIIKINK